MEQIPLDFDKVPKELDGKSVEKAHWVEVCDLPYFTEPMLFYDHRMNKGIRVRELREFACTLFEKENGALTVDDLKLAFLKMCPLPVSLGGGDHKVTVQKKGETWMLSCNCRAWIFNRYGNRTCKHTGYVADLMREGE